MKIALRAIIILAVLLGINYWFDTPNTCELCWIISLFFIIPLGMIISVCAIAFLMEWIFTGKVR